MPYGHGLKMKLLASSHVKGIHVIGYARNVISEYFFKAALSFFWDCIPSQEEQGEGEELFQKYSGCACYIASRGGGRGGGSKRRFASSEQPHQG